MMKKTHLALAVAVVAAVGASLFNSASADYKLVCDDVVVKYQISAGDGFSPGVLEKILLNKEPQIFNENSIEGLQIDGVTIIDPDVKELREK